MRSTDMEDAMHRRSLLWGVFSAVGAAFAASRANAATEAAPPIKPQEKLKVVYHLSDADKVSFVLGNTQNRATGSGGPDNGPIALVVHGPSLSAFHAASANPDIVR